MRLHIKSLVMVRDFIERRDNLLTKQECTDIIQWVCNNNNLIPDIHKNKHSGYDYYNIMFQDGNFNQCFSPAPLKPLGESIIKLKNYYQESNPELDRLDWWDIDYVRFKAWKPGEFYQAWHSEHDSNNPFMIMSFLIYLTDNDCSTEFRNYENVPTKAGRGIMFPAYFTHEHRGSPCKKGLDRFIVSGYFSFTHG